MIISDINRLDTCPHLGSILTQVLAMNPHDLESGEHQVDGRNFFINRISGLTREIAESKTEIHREYIDVHLVLAGVERVGYHTRPATNAFMRKHAFNNDAELLTELSGEQYLDLNKGQFVVFYPGIWHRPMICIGEVDNIEKVVIKIRLDYLNSLTS